MVCFKRSKVLFPTLSLSRDVPLSISTRRFTSSHQYARKESDTLLIKSLASPSPLQPPRLQQSLNIWESYTGYRRWIPDQENGVDDARLELTWLLRKTVGRSTKDFSNKDTRPNPHAIIQQIFDLYTQLIGQDKLEPIDTAAITELLRLMGGRQPDSIRLLLGRYIDLFAMDYVRKSLPPHPSASVYLLRYYRQTRQYEVAVKLWVWLRQQDDVYVNTIVYGEAITLVSILEYPLHACEDVYEEGKKRCSHEEIERLLEPGAMLPKELQKIRGFMVDSMLSTYIHNARLRRNDWQTAYLTLDTAFKIWPSSVPSWFLKNVVKTRPIHESYQVFMLFCKHRIVVRNKDFTVLLNNITRAGKVGGDLNVNISLARASWDAMKAGVETDSARLDLRHLSCLVRGILSVLPQRTLANSDVYHATDVIATDLISDLADWLHYSHGVPRSISTYNTALSMGGKLRNINLIQWALDSIGSVNLSLNKVSYSSLITAARYLEAPQLLKMAWKCLLGLPGIEPDQFTWDIFGWAAKKTGTLPYYHQQVRSFYAKGRISGELAKPAMYYLTSTDSTGISASHFDDNADRAIQGLLKDMSTTLKQFRSAKKTDPERIAEFPQSIWQWPNAVPEKWQRSLYDDMSSKATNPLPNDSPFLPPIFETRSFIGVHFEQLRYNSWKSFNALLLQADAFQKRGERSRMDRSVVQNEAFTRNSAFMDGSMRPDHLPFVLDHLADIKEEKMKKPYTEQEWREKILNLRRFDLNACKHEPEPEAQMS